MLKRYRNKFKHDSVRGSGSILLDKKRNICMLKRCVQKVVTVGLEEKRYLYCKNCKIIEHFYMMVLNFATFFKRKELEIFRRAKSLKILRKFRVKR